MATIEQAPGKADIRVVKGDDLSIQFSIDENLSGYSFIATIHPLNGGLVTCASVLVAATTSTVQVTFSGAITGALDATGKDGPHAWKLVYTDPSSSIRTWVAGSFTVTT
jgi:hypothetical protein